MLGNASTAGGGARADPPKVEHAFQGCRDGKELSSSEAVSIPGDRNHEGSATTTFASAPLLHATSTLNLSSGSWSLGPRPLWPQPGWSGSLRAKGELKPVCGIATKVRAKELERDKRPAPTGTSRRAAANQSPPRDGAESSTSKGSSAKGSGRNGKGVGERAGDGKECGGGGRPGEQGGAGEHRRLWKEVRIDRPASASGVARCCAPL